MVMDLTFCELREKECVNTVDGRRLGHVLDISFSCDGTVSGIVVPGEKKFFRNIIGSDSIFIPWRNISKIGDDIILVELSCSSPAKEN